MVDTTSGPQLRLLLGGASRPERRVFSGLPRPVQDALELELAGVRFYRDGAACADDPEISALFERFAELEEQHLRRLFFRYRASPQLAQPGGFSLPATVVYADQELPTDGDDLLELAADIEDRAREFLAEQRRSFEIGSPEWDLYRELEAEEADHARRLRDQLHRRRSARIA